jgi:MarR family transcriptional regulator for hemolysin
MNAKNRHSPIPHRQVGITVSARLGLLASRLVTTATATYGQLGLGSIEARVLLVLETQSIKPVKVSQLIEVDGAAVNRTVQMLVARNLVIRSARRDAYLSLTDRGTRLCRAVKAVAQEREKRLFEGFSAEELDTLLDFLHRVRLNAAADSTDRKVEQGESQDPQRPFRRAKFRDAAGSPFPFSGLEGLHRCAPVTISPLVRR